MGKKKPKNWKFDNFQLLAGDECTLFDDGTLIIRRDGHLMYVKGKPVE